MSTAEKQETVYFEVIAGGWSRYEKLTTEDETVFEEATQGIIGVSYTPLSVSRQIVSGTNYRFRCIARPSTIEPIQYEAIVQIYAPLKGKPFVTHIYPVL